jgi:tetratricopeptide (TPR) repeat protein
VNLTIMRHGVAGTAVAALLAGALAGVAEARNPHCAGGIQYVVQAMRDKEKGNLEDYQREINKAIQQLEMCASEDPADLEAIGYLGWAYAEVDSAGPAGRAFQTAIAGLEKKDPKKKDWAISNRNSYWARAFNEGIQKIQDAQKVYEDFCKEPKDDAQRSLKAEAQKMYGEAIVALTRANLLRPGDVQTMRNLGTVHALQCDFTGAEAIFRSGLEIAPGDTTLQEALRSVRGNLASKLVDQKDYDRAIASYAEMTKSEPTNADHWLGLADAYFKRAQAREGDARKADFRAAGDAYAKAVEIRATDFDLTFNAALAYQNAQAWDKAESFWARAVKLRSDDPDANSAWGAVLVELKRCPEAIQAVHRAVTIKPDNKVLHRQLGAVYTKCGNNARATEELMVYLAMDKGQPVPTADAPNHLKQSAGEAAKIFAKEGAPEQIYKWEAEGQKYETWAYFSKKLAFTFGAGGTMTTKTDWSSAVTSPPGSAAKK